MVCSELIEVGGWSGDVEEMRVLMERRKPW